MLKRLKWILLPILGLTLVSGCALLREEDPAAKTAIQFAVLKYIDEDTARADRVLEVVGEAERYVSSDAVTTLQALRERVVAEIDWTELDAAEQLLVRNLIDAVQAKLEEEIGEDALSAENEVAVKTVLSWIREAAVIAGGTTDGTVEDDAGAVADSAGHPHRGPAFGQERAGYRHQAPT